jgi:hypothetical protein
MPDDKSWTDNDTVQDIIDGFINGSAFVLAIIFLALPPLILGGLGYGIGSILGTESGRWVLAFIGAALGIIFDAGFMEAFDK